MKKNSIWNLAAVILVVVPLLVPQYAVSQENAAGRLLSRVVEQTDFLERLKSTLGVNVAAGNSAETPSIPLLREPSFTSTTSNIVYWNPIPATVTFQLNGQEITVGRDSCFVLLAWGPDENDPAEQFVTADKVSFTASIEKAWLGKKIYYESLMYVKYQGDLYWDTDSVSVVSSFQDVKAPRVDSLRIIGPGKNDWLTTHDFQIKYYVQDDAAISSAYLKGSIEAQNDTIFNGDPINPRPTSYSGVFELSVDTDDIYPFTFGACDAAFSPESHGEPGARWDVAGNCGETPDTVKIDTQAPIIDFSRVDSTYCPNNNIIDVRISDALSGVDPSSIVIDFIPPLPADVDTTIEKKFNDGVWQILITFVTMNIDMKTTLSLTASDNAGNSVVPPVQKVIDLIFMAPQVDSLRMVDLQFDAGICLNPAAGFTNATKVLLDNFTFVDKTADSLLIIGETDSVVKVYKPRLEFEITEVTAASLIQSGKELSLTIKGKDRYGNVEKTGKIRTITFDDQISPIVLSVNDPESVDNNPRHGAYPGWTNDKTVQVTISSPDRDLYRFERILPQELDSTCRDAELREFDYTFPNLDNRPWEFVYNAGDSAGNVAQSPLVTIKLDTRIFNPDSTYFLLSDTLTNVDFVEITYVDSSDSIPDLSRFVVNGFVYRSFVRDTVSVPARYTVKVPGNATGYIVSLIDWAGNESDSCTVPPPCPRFSFVLFDTSSFPDEALVGYTNEELVAWDFINRNFQETKLEKVRFCDAMGERCIDWNPDTDKKLSLRALYPDMETSPTPYKVTAEAFVTNWPQCPAGEPLPSFEIIFDNTRPKINPESLVLRDRKCNPWCADTLFANEHDVNLKTDLILPLSDDMVYMDIDGEVDSIWVNGGWIVPDRVDYSENYRISLSKADEEDGRDLKAVKVSVRDKAGNWSEPPAETSIQYVMQSIFNHAPNKVTITESDIDADSITVIPLGFSCLHPEDVWKVVTVDLARPKDSTEETIIDFASCEQQGDQYVCDVKFELVDDAQFTVTFVDRAGNCSDTDTTDIDVQIPPYISLTLYNYATFPKFASPTSVLPDTTGVDNAFTDESEPDSLVLLTTLQRGDWALIQYSFDANANWDSVASYAVADAEAKIDLRRIPRPQNLGPVDEIICYVRAINGVGVDTTSFDAIIYDSVTPKLESFAGSTMASTEDYDIVADPLGYEITYSGYDPEPGQLAGLVVSEYLLDVNGVKSDSQHVYLKHTPSQTVNFSLLEKQGKRYLRGFLVDRADIDYFRWEDGKKLDADDLNIINHPSNADTFMVRLNEKEISNFPNPFNPSKEATNLLFHVKDDTRVRISILDPFGNLVDEWETFCEKGMNTGEGGRIDLKWDGLKSNDKPVANGGYICIIDALDTGERHMRKIAVIKD